MADARNDVPDEVLYRRYDYDDGSVVVADLGAVAAEASVEVVDDTAIVVLEGEDGSRQFDLDLPDGGAHTFINNGVLTVEVNGS